MANQNARKSCLLNQVKVQVKQLMEESVVRSYVHEESNSISVLCAAVNAVLDYGLRSTFFDVFDADRTYLLCRRIAKHCSSAEQVLNRMEFYENALSWSANNHSSGNIGSLRSAARNSHNGYPNSGETGQAKRSKLGHSKSLRGFRFNGFKSFQSQSNTDNRCKHLWIRVALLEKVLAQILSFLSENSSQYYEKFAIMADPCDGLLLADLLRGPCTIDYSRTRTTDNFFTDPPVSELIKRHGMSSGLMSRQLPYVAPASDAMKNSTPPVRSIPNLTSLPQTTCPNGDQPETTTQMIDLENTMSRSSSSGSLSLSTDRSSIFGWSTESVSTLSAPRSARLPRRHLVKAAKEHVESMHQSFKPTLVYGKNNVYIPAHDKNCLLPGYLSVHDYGMEKGICINWTPNWAIASGTFNAWDHASMAPSPVGTTDPHELPRDLYWDYATRISLRDLVYVHYHSSDTSHLATFINREGLQLTPLSFDKKNNLDAFLSSLEQSIGKYGGRFDPPYGTAHSEASPENKTNSNTGFNFSSLFGLTLESPRILRRRDSSTTSRGGRRRARTLYDGMEGDLMQAVNLRQDTSHPWNPTAEHRVFMISFTMGTKHKKLLERAITERSPMSNLQPHLFEVRKPMSPSMLDSVDHMCTNLRRDILSQSFQKWLYLCRKMRLLRARLIRLVSPELATIDRPTNAANGMTADLWNALRSNLNHNFTFIDMCRHVYFGNCDPSIRRQVWPYLLGVYRWESTADELATLQECNRSKYVQALGEWKHAQLWIRNQDSPQLGDFGSEGDSNQVKEDEDVTMVDSPEVTPRPDLTSQDTEGKLCNGSVFPFPSTELPTTPTRSMNMESGSNNKSSPSILNCSASVKKSEAQTKCPFSVETLDALGLNLYRIDKDVSRCDRNHEFFARQRKHLDLRDREQSPNDQNELGENLLKLRNVICTWVWLHLDVGYIQGMCDLLAPLLVVLNDEVMTFACFCALMEWMLPNFPTARPQSPVLVEQQPHDSPTSPAPLRRPTLLMLSMGCSQTDAPTDMTDESSPPQRPVDIPLESPPEPIRAPGDTVPSPYTGTLEAHSLSYMNMRFMHLSDLTEIFDPELHNFLSRKAIDGQFYFCYRWLLLDFKREFKYDDVFAAWEVIWSARRFVCYDFGLFLAFAMLQYYRDIMLYYDMEMTEIIRFYNEMTEQHNVATLLELARSLVFQMQNLIQDT